MPVPTSECGFEAGCSLVVVVFVCPVAYLRLGVVRGAIL